MDHVHTYLKKKSALLNEAAASISWLRQLFWKSEQIILLCKLNYDFKALISTTQNVENKSPNMLNFNIQQKGFVWIPWNCGTLIQKEVWIYIGTPNFQATMPSDEKHPSRVPMWKGVKIAYTLVAMCLFPLAIAGYWAYGQMVTTAFNIFHTSTLSFTAIQCFVRLNQQKK